MYTCFIASPPKSRDEIVATLMEHGYSRHQASFTYRNYWLKFLAFRKRLVSEDEEGI
jgi:hypothetical protein